MQQSPLFLSQGSRTEMTAYQWPCPTFLRGIRCWAGRVEKAPAGGKSGNLQEGKNVCPLTLSSILRSRASGTVDLKHSTIVSVEKQHEYLIVPLSARISLRLCVCELS